MSHKDRPAYKRAVAADERRTPSGLPLIPFLLECVALNTRGLRYGIDAFPHRARGADERCFCYTSPVNAGKDY